MVHIRPATVADAPALLEILKQYIETPITLEHKLPTLDEMAEKIAVRSKNFPTIVIETEDGIVGYAFANRNAVKSGLSWNAELRAFVRMNQRGHHYGTKLMTVLIDLLKLQNVRNVYSNVTEGNPRSDSLHKKLGFTICGVLHKSGFKNGRWLDVEVFEKRICDEDFTEEPASFIPASEVDPAAMEEIFKSHEADED